MAGPATAAAIQALSQLVLPTLSGVFGNKKQPPTTEEILQLLQKHYGASLAPAIQGMKQAGLQTGAAVNQSFRSAAGRAGALRTGVGAVGAGLASSAASNRAANAEFQGARAVSELTATAFPGVASYELGTTPLRTNRFQDVLAGLGGYQSTTGYDPIKALVNAGVRLFGTQRQAPPLQDTAKYNQTAQFGSLRRR